jgi:acetyltransferase-like isoleucine patch superfamily enzyme
VDCDEVFCVGALTHFEPRLRLRCRRTFIGAGGYFSEDIHIGGGGVGDPQALLVMGDLAFVGAEAFINPCRPVVVGREVFVTMRSVLVTHNVGHSLLEGFENRFAPIVLEDRSQVGIGAVVYAGCRIGAESIVASNSYVVSDIPPGKLAIGVPARVAGHSSRALTTERRLELARKMVAELHEQLVLRGHDVGAVAERPVQGLAITFEGRTSHVLFREHLDGAFAPPENDGETVVLTFGIEGDPPDGCSVLELVNRRFHGPGGVVLDSVREFCRKRGIRFEPGPWRYRGGLV